MIEKWKNRATVALLAAFLFGFGLWAAVKAPDDFSLSERRKLAQLPTASVESILNGKYMAALDSYALDQFPLRDEWRTLKALTSRYLLAQKDSSGVYFVDGYAAKLDRPLNEGSIDYAAERFRYLYEEFLSAGAAKVYLSVIPDKSHFFAAENGYPAPDFASLVALLRAQTDDFAQYIDLSGALTLDSYYRTDSHWRQETLLPVAEKLAEAMGVTLGDAYTEVTLERPYYGVYCGYAALPMKPDALTYLTSDTLENCTVYNYETGKVGAVYDLARGEGNDPYELFLSGSISLLTIENPNAAGDRELIVFRDSFGSSLAPLLAEGYARITLADIRYLPASQLGKLLTLDGRQDVLFLYSAAVLNNSETLK